MKLEVRLSIPVGAKFILDRLNTSAISVHEPKYLHAFSYNAVAVIVDIGKVFGRGFAIESSGIHYFDTVVILIELHRAISLVISVADGVHQQLASSPVWIIDNHFFT